MKNTSIFISLFFYSILGFGQQIEDVQKSFKSLSSEPEIIILKNKIKVPSNTGHFQGVQIIENEDDKKILISGSSLTKSYFLQGDLATKETEKLILLMKAPYRHAGGIQSSKDYVVVGIEDNFTKTSSKVCLYKPSNLHQSLPNMIINRKGKVEKKTAGATGLLSIENNYLTVVSNWNSRNWDFLLIDPIKKKKTILESFNSPKNWADYQSINLIMDKKDIYALGFYRIDHVDYADLILVSSRTGTFKLKMKKLATKTFNCKNGVDFSGAAGLQVDKKGELHIWSTQKKTSQQIVVNQFSKK